MRHGVCLAARDLIDGNGSPSADVYLVQADMQLVGTAHAVDASAQWRWAHPAVEQRLIELDAEID